MDRYSNEAKRLYGVIDKRLAKPTRRRRLHHRRYRHLPVAALLAEPGHRLVRISRTSRRWFDAIAARPAVQRGVEVLAEPRKPITDDKAREILFGKTQYQRH